MTHALTLDEEPFLADVLGFLETTDFLELKTAVESPVTNHSDVASQASSGSDETTCRSSKRELERNRQRRYRQRLKDSRESLLKQVDELSAQVDQLSQFASEAKFLSEAATSWITVLNRQREKRQRAEEEHERLVAAVSSQATYLKCLANCCPGGGAISDELERMVKVPRLHSMASTLYTMHLQRLEGCYARVDTVLEASGLSALPESTRFSVHRHHSTGEVAYLQHVNKALVPFSYKVFCDAMWKLLNVKDGDTVDPRAPVPASDIVDKTRLQKPVPAAELFQRYVSRRYVESGRVVIVWTMSYEGDGIFKGLHSDELGWMCLRPSGSGTQLEVCVQQVPTRSGLPSDGPALGQFYKVLETTLSNDKEVVQTALERLVLNDSQVEICY